jgi:transmembrane sensor
MDYSDYSHYADYSEEDFILDESFIEWFKGKDSSNAAFWEAWVEAHPEKRETVENARKFLSGLYFNEQVFSEEETHQEWRLLQQTLHRSEESLASQPVVEFVPVSPVRKPFGGWYRVAAAVTGLLLVSVLVWMFRMSEQEVRYTTGYGETKEISLPDGSVVVLNAHSSIRYPGNWDNRPEREVWLEGEAYFEVVKKQTEEANLTNARRVKFVVHTDQVNVEVLGTEFNVKERRGNTQVVLNSGRINLKGSGKLTADSLLMNPGELVQLSRQSDAVIKRKVNPEMFSSWRKNILIFDRTPLHEVASIIEDTYGLKVVFEDQLQANRVLTGTIPASNVDILLLALAKSFKFEVSRQNNIVKLKNSPL